MRRPLGVVATMLAAGAAAMAVPVAAQEAAVEPARPAARTPLQPDAARLRPGEYRYDVLIAGDSGPRSIGTHVITVREAQFAGRQAWAVVDHRESAPPFAVRIATDTVMLDAGTLRPLRWDASAGGARFVAAFTSDSIYGGGSSPGLGARPAAARQTFSIPGPRATVTSEGALEAVLQTAALGLGWATAGSMLLIDLDTARTILLELTVEREEPIYIVAGLFDSWVLSVRAGAAERWLWIDKATGVVLRAMETPRHMPGVTVERVLLHAPGGEPAPAP